MTDSRDSVPTPTPTGPASPTAADLPLTSTDPVASSPLVRLGGVLGIAGVALGFTTLVVGCAGYSKAMAAGVVVAGFGALGLLIVLIGAFTQHKRISEDTHVLQGLFTCVLAIAGGLLEMAVHHRWPIVK
jgi:hypothetical protein